MEPEKSLSTNISQKNIDLASVFQRDANFVFIYKKIEKLASAAYIITSLFSDNEPIKWVLRKKSADLLSFSVALTYKETSNSSQVDLVHDLKIKVVELVSLFEISSNGGLISAMNFSVLKNEFFNLIDMLNTSTSLPDKLVQKSVSEILSSLDYTYTQSPKSAEEKTFGQSVDASKVAHAMSFSSVKDRQLPKTINNDNLKKSNRQSIILSFLRKKREATIKDIIEVIKDCSEKTVQRELNYLISKGVLKRVGVRRWSKYSISLLGAM